ncbi:MAG TPA: BACON domain-containing carbohydrate-binding protein [Vicinamibacterales bacterium]
MDARLFVCASFAAVVTAALVSCNKASPTGPTPVCTYTISPGGSAISSDGGTGTVTVTAPASCSWTATSTADWIAITAGASGSGSGTVTYSAGSNASATTRSGAVMIAGQSHSITQQGRAPSACSYDLLPANAEFSKDGGSGTFTVTAPADCAWTASSSAPWLLISGGGQGTGTATIAYTVARHTDVAERTASIAVADRRFNVRQSGDVSLCQYSVAPVLLNPCMAGGSVTAAITTQASCPWTATPNVIWLTVPTGTSGSGSASMSIAFPDNYDAPREGTVMVRWPTPTAGQNIRIAQAGCRYAVSKTAISIAASGGTGTFDVIQQSDPMECGGATQNRCVWTARSEVAWITITSSMPQSGDNPVSFTVSANDSTAPRTGTVVVRDKVVIVTEAGK